MFLEDSGPIHFVLGLNFFQTSCSRIYLSTPTLATFGIELLPTILIYEYHCCTKSHRPTTMSMHSTVDVTKYVSMLSNIKRRALNAGIPDADFEIYLRRVRQKVFSATYNRYSLPDKLWHVDYFMWEHFCKLLLFSARSVLVPASFLPSSPSYFAYLHIRPNKS